MWTVTNDDPGSTGVWTQANVYAYIRIALPIQTDACCSNNFIIVTYIVCMMKIETDIHVTLLKAHLNYVASAVP